MSEKVRMIAAKAAGHCEGRELVLESGRRVAVSSCGDDEVLEITSASGEVELKVTLGPGGPVISLVGARLDISAREEINISSKRVNVRAEERVEVKSGGPLDIDARDEMKINSEKDVRVKGEIIHLN
jgi:uncharacterized protein (DUF2345 family)